jgi:hypothetical protein
MTETNARVTNAILATKMDHVEKKLDRLSENLEDHCAVIDQRLIKDERDLTKLQTNMENLESRVRTWDITNSVLAVVAGLLAAIGITKQ